MQWLGELQFAGFVKHGDKKGFVLVLKKNVPKHLLTLYILNFSPQNIKMYQQYISFLHTDMTQEVEILSHVR